MQQKTKDKLLLCLQEMAWVKEILDEKCASNQLAHVLGIYAAIRMSDFIHLLPVFPSTDDKSAYIDEHRRGYKAKLEEARNKLGAHFQTIVKEEETTTAGTDERRSDYIERNRVFQGIDYKTVTNEIENAGIVYQIATETEDTVPAIALLNEEDKQKVLEICRRTNHDGATVISTDILNISRPNAICLISGSSAQQKAQQLLSVEQFVADIRQLYGSDYHDAGLGRMFKRMMICWMMNFYDNLVTRPVDPSKPQYDEGFDKKVVNMFEKEGLAVEAEACRSYYDNMHGLKDAEQIIDDARGVRNKCCGHLDGAMDVTGINGMMDGYDMAPLTDLYGKWVRTFHEMLEIHVILSHLYLPQNKVYNVQTEKINGNFFYGNEVTAYPSQYDTGSLMVEQAMNVISKGERNQLFALADEKIQMLLKQAKGEEYKELKKLLLDKYSNGINRNELVYYCHALRMAKQGFPDKNIDLILDLWEHLKDYPDELHRWLLIPMMWNARFDKKGRVQKVINELNTSNDSGHFVFGGLLLLFASYRKDCGLFAYRDNPAYNKALTDYLDGTGEKPIRLATSLAMASYWFTDELYHKSWQSYSDALSDLAKLCLEQYLGEITVEDDDKDFLRKLLEEKRFVELTWYLIKGEQQMDRGVKCFENLVENAQIRGYLWITERAYWALCQEEIGNVDEAHRLLKKLMDERLYDKGMALSTCKFLGRHSRYDAEREGLIAEIEKMFSLTDDERTWME